MAAAVSANAAAAVGLEGVAVAALVGRSIGTGSEQCSTRYEMN